MQSKIRPTSGGFGIDYQVWVGNSLAHGEGCNAIGAYVRYVVEDIDEVIQPTEIVAIDCEMVKVKGRKLALGHCVVVNEDEEVLFNRYVKPKTAIMDYMTWVSGIEPAHLQGEGVLPHDNAVRMIRSLLEGKIVVGHDIKNDFRAIEFTCPESDIRDTAYCRVIRDRLGVATLPRLKRLVSVFLADDLPGFQSGAHNPVEDAIASLKLLKKFKTNWETIPRTRPLTLSDCRPAGMSDEDEDEYTLNV